MNPSYPDSGHEGLSGQKVPWQIPTFPVEERDRRYAALRQSMEERGIDCLIVAGHQGNYGDRTANFRYVANYAPWFDDEYVIFPRSGEPILLTLLIGHADWAKRVSWIEQIKITGKTGYINALAGHVRDLGFERATIGICDFETTPTYVYVGLQQGLPHARLLDVGDVLSRLRMVKSPLELGFMERAGECADIGCQAMLAAARPGIPDTELYIACEDAMTRAGAEPPSFTLLSAARSFREKGFGLSPAGCGRIMQKGDLVLNEISPSYGGYWVQMNAPMVLGGPIPEDLHRVFSVHMEMYQLAVSEMRPGVTIEAVNSKVRDVAFSRGCDRTMAWALQHVGLRILEPLPPETVLQPGMTFVVQPITEHEATYGGHTVGNTVAVTEGGCRVLSKIPLQIHQIPA